MWLANGTELKVVTAEDDHSRFSLLVRVVRRATGRAVCAGFAAALASTYAHVLNDTLTRAADVMAKGLAEAADLDGQDTREPGQNSEGSSWAREWLESFRAMRPQGASSGL